MSGHSLESFNGLGIFGRVQVCYLLHLGKLSLLDAFTVCQLSMFVTFWTLNDIEYKEPASQGWAMLFM